MQRDFHVRAGNAFYSVPWRLAGQQVRVRADGTLVKIYHRGQVVRTHPQQPAGGRVSEAADFPPDTDIYARRDVDKLAKMAAVRGEAIGIHAARILDTPLPWTKMRAVYTLIGLARTSVAVANSRGSRASRANRAAVTPAAASPACRWRTAACFPVPFSTMLLILPKLITSSSRAAAQALLDRVLAVGIRTQVFPGGRDDADNGAAVGADQS